jgi:RNA polymerase sigma-70 factor (ECF subfamily)
MDDRELIRRFWNGDSSAFDDLIRKHKARLMETVMRVVKNRETAADLYQDALIRIHGLLTEKKYRDEDKFLPWAARIAHNMAIDALRKQKRQGVERAPQGLEEVLAGGDAPDDSLVKCEIHRDLRRLVAQLPKSQREVLFLRIYNRMSFKEIAAFTDCSINTALGRMRYAISNMRKQVRRFPAVYL